MKFVTLKRTGDGKEVEVNLETVETMHWDTPSDCCIIAFVSGRMICVCEHPQHIKAKAA